MCRGNHRHDIYRDDEDRQVYLTLLRETKKEYKFYLHSYCLMTNHVHLHIETEDINISIIMKRINLLYAQFFNNKYNFVGHLFQDRFKSELIETDQYHLEIGRYIHLNPVRANMTELPIDYTWSSYRVYMLGQGFSRSVDPLPKGSDPTKIRQIIHDKLYISIKNPWRPVLSGIPRILQCNTM
jgi:REP element-mobilizing transposase RayT